MQKKDSQYIAEFGGILKNLLMTKDQLNAMIQSQGINKLQKVKFYKVIEITIKANSDGWEIVE